MGLTISPTQTEVVVFSAPPSDSSDPKIGADLPAPQWHIGSSQLLVCSSFEYLGLIFHEPGSMQPALARLVHNGNGAKAGAAAKYKELHCDKSFLMIRRLFDAVVKPTASYGSKGWGTSCMEGCLKT